MTPRPALRERTIALVGLMGVGKTTIGRKLAQTLGLPFHDADHEIEAAAGCSIPEIFAKMGEEEFRAGERRVIARLLKSGPHVLATGGGAFIDPEIRASIERDAISVWLKADIDVMVRRVSRKDTRPLLSGKNPRTVLTALMADRYPIYAQADLTVATDDRPVGEAVNAIVAALERRLETRASC